MLFRSKGAVRAKDYEKIVTLGMRGDGDAHVAAHADADDADLADLGVAGDFLCAQRGLEPVATYALLARQYEAPRLKGPLNLDARRRAGFDEAELALLG